MIGDANEVDSTYYGLTGACLEIPDVVATAICMFNEVMNRMDPSEVRLSGFGTMADGETS